MVANINKNMRKSHPPQVLWKSKT